MKVYFDNAATTPLDEEVIEEMVSVMRQKFGNPSSVHSYGREVRAIIEMSRRSIAALLHTAPAEIVFTSGGTEADNIAIWASVAHLGAERVITSALEHHAVLDASERAAKEHNLPFLLVDHDDKGRVDLTHLENLLAGGGKAFVSLMHANNELGNLTDIHKVGEICARYGAIFHSDTVQTIGHYDLNLSETGLDFAACSAHKFHGPKGIGFLYVNRRNKIPSLFLGGGQERQMRAGTENVYGIAGMARALEIAIRDLKSHQLHIRELKSYMIQQVIEKLPAAEFNGDTGENSLYTVLNVSLPPTSKSSILLFSLDLLGVAVSGGSACSSGAQKGSHVLTAINADLQRPAVRFSFSKYTTKEDVDFAVDRLRDIYKA
jgi:cysteine desulfurase